MTDAARNPDDYCYRHPDRQSFVLCERCGRTICLECQNHVGGRVLCPDDAKSSNVTMMPVNARPPKPKRVRRQSRLFAWVTDATPIVTYGLLAVLLVVFIVDLSLNGRVSLYLGVYPSGSGVDVLHQPWSLLTSMILPGSVLGLLINGYSTFVLGGQLERLFGHRKFIVLFVLSGFGASVVSFLLNQSLTYSIGAIGGLVAATVIVARRMGANMIFLYVTCAINLVFAIIFGQWAGIIGGALAGTAVTFTYLYDDGSEHHRRSRLLLIGVAVVLLALAVIRAVVFGG